VTTPSAVLRDEDQPGRRAQPGDLGQTQNSHPALEASGITKSFSGVQALRGVSLVVARGEIVGLAGANGAGKSTLVNIITGVLPPDGGTVKVAGRDVRLNSVQDAQRSGIGTVRQELDLVPALSVAENIFLGDETRFTRFGVLDVASMRSAASALLARVGLGLLATELVASLSIGDRQLVAAARALRDAASVLILDEPTSSLSPFESQRLYDVIRRLSAAGVGVVFISHRLPEVAEICDRVVVMRDGLVAAEFPAERERMAEVVDVMVPGVTGATDRSRSADPGEVVLRLNGVAAAGKSSTDLTVRAGEIVGLFGLVGSGRSTIGRAVAGIVPLDSGTMALRGRPYAPKSPADGFRRGVAYLSEDRRGESVLPGLTVSENLALRLPQQTSRWGLVRFDRVRDLVRRSMTKFKIRASSPSTSIDTLSGGNQQKVLLARLLAEELSVLVLDEPTHGIDVSAKRELLRTLDQFTEQGLAVLMISSDVPELITSADRILVVRDGRVHEEFSWQDSDERTLMSAATGGTER